MQTIAEPLLVTPRLDAKPWGGTRLADFGIDLKGQTDIGEAVLTSSDVIVAQGPMSGQSIQSLVTANPAGLLGRSQNANSRGEFPLLVKLIDAHQNLSIQVHPDDERAPAGCNGKTEAWYILAADPGALIYAGLHEGITAEDVEVRIDVGESIVPLLRSIPARPGEVLFIPAGTIHALGAGIVIYEIQQQSAVTYRLEDWGRAREMHIAPGLACLDPASRPVPHMPGLRTARSRPRPAIDCEHFALEVIQMAPGDHVVIAPESSPQVFTCTFGEVELGAAQGHLIMESGATAILFANAGPARLSSLHGARVLRGWVPG